MFSRVFHGWFVVVAVGDYSPAYSQWMISPAGWAVSVGLGVWVVLRYRPSRC